MKFNLRLFAILFISVLGFANTNAIAQTKSLTNDQYFKNDFKGIISPLPRVGSWVDDNSFLLIKNQSLHYTVTLIQFIEAIHVHPD